MGFEEDNGYVRGSSTYDEDAMREIEAEVEQERLDMLGVYDDPEPAPVEDDDFYPEFETDYDYPNQLPRVTLNGGPVFEDDELDKAFEANFHGKVIGVYDTIEQAQAAEDKAYEEEEEELRGKLHGIYSDDED